jgi:hypothetical protein
MPSHPFSGGNIIVHFDPCPHCGSYNLSIMGDIDISNSITSYYSTLRRLYSYCGSCGLKWRDNELIANGKITCDDQR